MNSIIPNLWFDKNALEAVRFYTSVFENSSKGQTAYYGDEGTEIHGMPEGTPMSIEFKIKGLNLVALNGGPHFKFNESVSFYVYCGSDREVERLYNLLAEGGSINMRLDKYDWSEKYAWVKDKFGVSWQLDADDINSDQKIVPSLLFVNDKFNKVKDAVNYYTNIFSDSKIIFSSPHPGNEDNLLFAQFSLNSNLFNAMSGAGEHKFDFNEAVSLIINCESQEEVNYYWEKLTDGGSESMCGWLKDKYGVSWQVIPSMLKKLISDPDKEKASRVMAVLLQMKKLDSELLQKAFDGIE
jgi:predicted 3-demethylubiquinone-9 3-methyltransferase (glyoxalase superfamily)